MTRPSVTALTACGGAADARRLWSIAVRVRAFLEPHWPRWHEAWGPPIPPIPSQWTCVRSSLMLCRALKGQGIKATLESGQDRDAQRWGLVTGDGTLGHAWVEAAGFIVDITADQFGRPPVIVTPEPDPAYRRATEEAGRIRLSQAAIRAVDTIWPFWCDLERHRHDTQLPA